MFSEIIAMLKRGEFPSTAEIQTRLDPALVKKSGVLQQPKSCWSNDPKINPDFTHLLWAAILHGDHGRINMVTGMILMEQQNEPNELTPEKARALIVEKCSNLPALAPNPSFKNLLTQKINMAADSICPK